MKRTTALKLRSLIERIVREEKSNSFVKKRFIKEWDEDEYEDEDMYDNEQDEPDEEDIFVSENRKGTYDIFYAGKNIASNVDSEDIESTIKKWTNKKKYWPNAWMEGERGDYSLIMYH